MKYRKQRRGWTGRASERDFFGLRTAESESIGANANGRSVIIGRHSRFNLGGGIDFSTNLHTIPGDCTVPIRESLLWSKKNGLLPWDTFCIDKVTTLQCY
jgi:hypothetical protein